nr:hypothetical protein [Tanacetum cinerariifolium]
VLKIDWLSNVETDKVIHNVETKIVKLVVEIESFGMSYDKLDKKIGSSDGLKPKQADLSCVHILNELYLHEIHDVLIPTANSVTTANFEKLLIQFQLQIQLATTNSVPTANSVTTANSEAANYGAANYDETHNL